MNFMPEIAKVATLLAINLMLVWAVLALTVAAALRLARAAHPRIRYAVVVFAFFFSVFLPIWLTFNFSEERETLLFKAAENLERENRAKI